MLFDSFICRRILDSERGGPWICECPLCKEAKGSEEDERLLHSDGTGGALQRQSENDLPETVGQRDSGL